MVSDRYFFFFDRYFLLPYYTTRHTYSSSPSFWCYRCADNNETGRRGFSTDKQSLSNLIKKMIDDYNKDNKDALFHSGCNEPFKGHTWELLGHIANARDITNESQSVEKKKQEEIAETSKEKKARILSEVLDNRPGNSRPSTIMEMVTPRAESHVTPRAPSSASTLKHDEEVIDVEA